MSRRMPSRRSARSACGSRPCTCRAIARGCRPGSACCRRRPSQVAYYRSAALEARARELIAEGPDAVFVQLFRMAPAIAAASHPAKVLFLGIRSP
jgi:hypothetical protein